MYQELQTTLAVEGMTCGSCIRHINKALGELDGVRIVDVKLREGKVVVHHDATSAPVSTLTSTATSESRRWCVLQHDRLRRGRRSGGRRPAPG